MDTATSFRVHRGAVQFTRMASEYHQAAGAYPDNSAPWTHFTMPVDPHAVGNRVPVQFEFAGFVYGDYGAPVERTAEGLRSKRHFMLSVPCWLLAVLLAQAPAVWWRRRGAAANPTSRGEVVQKDALVR